MQCGDLVLQVDLCKELGGRYTSVRDTLVWGGHAKFLTNPQVSSILKLCKYFRRCSWPTSRTGTTGPTPPSGGARCLLHPSTPLSKPPSPDLHGGGVPRVGRHPLGAAPLQEGQGRHPRPPPRHGGDGRGRTVWICLRRNLNLF